MRITQTTTIEEMVTEFNLCIMRVVEGEYAVDKWAEHESGKETIRLEGVEGSWIKSAQFGPETKRSVLDIQRFAIDRLDIQPYFLGGDFPEPLHVGDCIACLCSKISDGPWIVTAWVPKDTYYQFLDRVRMKYRRYSSE